LEDVEPEQKIEEVVPEQKEEEDTTLLEKKENPYEELSKEEDKNPEPTGEVTFDFTSLPQHPMIPILLAASFFMNCVALIVPFMTTEIILKGTKTYNITSLIREMWTKGIYWPTILIVLFSVIFPFMKLGSLTYLFFKK